MKKILNETLFRLTDRFEENKGFMSIRQGLTMMIPFIVLGSFALMLKSLPIEPYQRFLNGLLNGRVVEILDYIYGGSFQVFSIALAIATSVSYAMIHSSKAGDINRKVKSYRAVVYDCFVLALITLISLMGYVGIQKESFSVSSMGTTNTFMTLLITIGCGKLYFKVRKSRLTSWIKRPETSANGLYYTAVQSIIPAAVVVTSFAVGCQLFNWIFHVDSLQDALVNLMEWVLSFFHGGLSSGLAILLLIHTMWFFGLHGSNVLDVVIQKNYTAVDGIIIYSKTFQDVFAIMGGCGAVLGLVIAMLIFSRKKVTKNVAKLALPGVLFNISEVVIFGLPIIFNPVFLLPFVMVPLFNFLVSYAAMYFHLVPRVVNQVEWTAPIFLSGYQATGSLAGSVLQLVCLTGDILLYRPFIRLYEMHGDLIMIRRVNQLVEFLQREEDANKSSVLTEREDMLGNIARILAGDLRGAIERGELMMLYQPQVNGEEKCIGAEALLRWKHPVAGFIYPPLIIRLAKESGMLGRLEEFIFDTAAGALERVEHETQKPCKISVNVTNASLMRPGFETMVEEYVKKHNVSRELLWMEITEQDALSSSDDIGDKLEKLKRKGHKFLIDDFGMGHTSLLYLQTNSFEIVKLDGSITRDVLQNQRHRDILKSIVYLGELLNFRTVAEFVETKEQMESLKELGIYAFQGYYYSRPIPLEDLLVWIRAH